MVGVRFEQINESFIRIVTADFGIDQEISEFFCFMADGYKFSPKFRAGVWDGKIRIFDIRNKKLPKGLLKVAVKFCKDRNYTFSIDPLLNPKTSIDEQILTEWIDNIQLSSKGKEIQLRDYQVSAIQQMMRYYRNLCISPTSSGKSAMLYYKIRYHVDVLDHNVVVVVPTTQLVEQLFKDFIDYSELNKWDAVGNCQLLYSGKEKTFNKKVMISTWQSLAAMAKFQPEMFHDIIEVTDCLCLDEVHQFASKVTLETANKFINAKWRTGTTGTLDDSKINKLQLIGLMSEPYQVITTRELMDEKSVVDLKIKVCKIEYPEWWKKQFSGMAYREEINYLVTYLPRNKFIAELASNTKGCTIVLYTYIEKHGVILDQLIRTMNPDREVRFVHGGVDIEAREEVRTIAESGKSVIIIASSAIFSTGVNIPAIENVIFAMPTKSTVRVRQSIGRGLRLLKGKSHCTLFDIADDMSYKSYTNTTLRHMFSRIEVYEKEQFEFDVVKINLSRFMDEEIPGLEFAD